MAHAEKKNIRNTKNSTDGLTTECTLSIDELKEQVIPQQPPGYRETRRPKKKKNSSQTLAI